MNLSLTFSRRLWLLTLLFILGGALTVGLSALFERLPMAPEAALRIATVVQQLLMFMLPAVGCAVLITRRPADFLGIRQLPSAGMLGASLLTLIVALPALNCLVEAFGLLPWPESVVKGEEAAQEAYGLLMGKGVAATILGVCIIAIIPGLCEELFFRGALQNLLRSKPMSVHLAVWIAAIVFSLLHFQPIGFVPRMILGAGFGYLAVWTGSLWTAVACHMLNNAVSVLTMQTGVDPGFVGLSTPVLSVVSAVLTAVGLRFIYSRSV